MTKYISYSFIDEYDKNTFSQFPHISYFSKIDDVFYITIPPMIVNAFKKNSIESFLSLKTFFYFRQKSSHNFFNLVLKNSSENINSYSNYTLIYNKIKKENLKITKLLLLNLF